MDHETHRANTVAGLLDLANFLELYDMSAALNTASPAEVVYCVLEKDTETARAEFERRARFLSEYGGSQRFTQKTRVGAESTQHLAELTFGEGRVVYRVLWIEQKETQADV